MKIFKKLSVALITVLFGAVLLSAPVLASTSTSALQAQINALMAEIQQLQTQLNQQTNSAPVVGSSTSISACNFTRDLGVGSQGSDVSCLQQYLNAAGFTISNITGYFGLETRDALAKWQAANGIYPSTGFFGNYSREEYAKTVGSLESQNASNQANSSNQSSLITASEISETAGFPLIDQTNSTGEPTAPSPPPLSPKAVIKEDWLELLA